MINIKTTLLGNHADCNYARVWGTIQNTDIKDEFYQPGKGKIGEEMKFKLF